MAFESMTLCVSHSPGCARDTEERFGTAFRAGLASARDRVRAFAPTLVIYFGSDHRRAFTDVVPSFSVVTSAEGRGDLLSPTGPYDVPRPTAEALAAHLLDAGFDIAVTRQAALDHGFGQTAGDLFGRLDAVAILPVFINCASAPLARPGRAAELGAAVGAFARDLDERVLFLGSGGLSHDPPTLALTAEGLPQEERNKISAAHREAAKDRIRPDWDGDLMARFGSSDPAWASAVTQADVDPAGVGANEARTWLAAYAAGGRPLKPVVYEPVREWLTGMGICMSEAAA